LLAISLVRPGHAECLPSRELTVPTTTPHFDLASCPHDRGPGIAVCLRCRADSHRKAAAARRRIAMQVALGMAGVAIAIVAGNNILAARPRVAASDGGVTQAGTSVSSRPQSFSVARADAQEPAASTAPAPALAPVISGGRTDMRYCRYVERSGDSITVHFDTPVFRTRRRDKFEQVVRGTLPLVYGAFADSILAAVPAGTIGDDGDLLADLPARGVQLPPQGGWTLTLWPGLRPGKDGPLVVSYRITVARGQ
jgi:hypothetical protein